MMYKSENDCVKKKGSAWCTYKCARKERERESERAAFPRPFLINHHLFEKIQHRVSLSLIGEEKKFARERDIDSQIST